MAHEGEKDWKRRKLDHTADAPTALTITRLVDSHAKEIRALTKAVQGKKKRNTSQDIPHYMRRRAASHNINRLPRNVRNKISKNKIPPGKPKKPSRYHKRRPKNLTAEFTRRQRRVRWLETHIWHAKRFHMIEKWGYRLPHYPTEKGERATYRAATNHCLIQDQSYIHCIEIKAPLLVMIDKLNKLIPNSQLDTDSVSTYSDGRSVLRGSLYDPDSYPPSVICPVEIIFNSRPTNQSQHHAWQQQHVWLWCHVTAQPTVWSIICKLFHVRCQQEDFSEADADSRAQYPDLTNTDKSISVKSLVDSVIRFRLNGRETLETLDRVIKPSSTNPAAVGAHIWWKEELGDTYGEITKSIKQSYDHRTAPPGAVLTVRARDPRLCMTQIQKHMTDLREKKVELAEKQRERSMYGLPLPPEDTNGSIGKQKEKKQKSGKTAESKSVPSNDESGPAPPPASEPAPPPRSPLWRDSVRRIVSSEMMSQYDINKRRSQLLVPGSELSLGDEESCVPLMLLLDQKSATLILPANWGLPFWVAFQYAGARPGGLRESRMIDFETGIPHFPLDFPDSAICAHQELTDAEELKIKHHKYPPNKRPNYDKLNTSSPFRFDWSGIIEGSSPAVLRDLSCLQNIQQLLEPDGTEPSASDCVNIMPDSNLLHVSLSMINRGVPEERAEICIPTTDDISELRLGKCKYGFEMPLNKTKTVIPRDETHTVVEMKDRLTPYREVFGFVKYGRYSQGTGTSKGKGFVNLQTLLKLTVNKTMIYQTDKVSGLLCLVRSVDSRQYRWATLNTL